jgi:hypothetical protein
VAALIGEIDVAEPLGSTRLVEEAGLDETGHDGLDQVGVRVDDGDTDALTDERDGHRRQQG